MLTIYWIAMYSNFDGTLLAGDVYKKQSTAEKEGYGYYKKLGVVAIELSDEDYKKIKGE